MKKDGKYRFSLQFPDETSEQHEVGDLLDRLGNRKSAVVVAAVGEYMLSHPELQSKSSKIEVRISSGITQEKIEQMVRSMVDERFASLQMSEAPRREEDSLPEALTEDIETMLGNLDLFQN